MCDNPSCGVCAIRDGKAPCTNCSASIVIRHFGMTSHFVIEACPVCQCFEEDSDAANAVTKLLELLAKAPGATVADKFDALARGLEVAS